MHANQQAVLSYIHDTAQQDKDQAAFLLESFAIELARDDRHGSRTIPIVFASCGDEDGTGQEVVIVRN